MKTVLVTGAAGFLGRHMVESLRRQPTVRVLEYDLGTAAADFEAALAQADAIVHLAGVNRPKDPAEFKALLAMSTYHAIQDGKTYPGVLLVHGLNDPRVDVWHSAKTAARLQAAQASLPDARPALLRLDAQAGHGMGSTLTQRQSMSADTQSFLLWQMGKLGLKD